MKYKSGDKVVFKIDEHDASDLNNGNDVSFYSEQLLGKLEDLTLAEEKIKMTVEEKKEFDRLCQNSGDDIADLFDNIADYYHIYPNLNKRLFLGTLEKNKKVQCEFVRALEKPNLIEVEKEKKYYVHLLETDPCGYLNYDVLDKEYFIGSKGESNDYKTKFTKSEIAKMHFANFKFNDKALEEVEYD